MGYPEHLTYTEPKNLRKAEYGEHFCLIFHKTTGNYVGALFLNAQMRKVWRRNGFGLAIIDV